MWERGGKGGMEEGVECLRKGRLGFVGEERKGCPGIRGRAVWKGVGCVGEGRKGVCGRGSGMCEVVDEVEGEGVGRARLWREGWKGGKGGVGWLSPTRCGSFCSSSWRRQIYSRSLRLKG